MSKPSRTWRLNVLIAVALCFQITSGIAAAQTPTNKATANVIEVSGDIEGIHDPSMIQDKGIWYVFSTQTGPTSEGELPIHCSKDLHRWTRCGSVLQSIPAWIKKQSPGTKGLWAPDISYFSGMFHLYYAFSLFGKNTSGIALLTNKTLDQTSSDYRWDDEGLVLLSNATDDFNTIDPNLVTDRNGAHWLAFGSFWSGIKMRKLNASGKLDPSDAKTYSLAGRKKPDNPPPAKPGLPADWQAIEAPFIVTHGGYYYLFVSLDLCCRGAKSTYKIAVGRSKEVTGPYVDENGAPLAGGGGTVILAGNHVWAGPGGQSVAKDGEDMMVFHAYDSTSGKPSLQLSTISWQSGWPRITLAGNITAN
jgi:arabinan endo-1,5-alpha-L-arabinosidase